MSSMRGVLCLCAVLALIGCSGAQRGAKPTAPTVDTAVEEALIEALTTDPELAAPPTAEDDSRRGILGLFRRKKDVVETPNATVAGEISSDPVVASDAASLIETPSVAGVESPSTHDPDTEVAPVNISPNVAPDPSDNRRLFGFLRKRSSYNAPALTSVAPDDPLAGIPMDDVEDEPTLAVVEASLNAEPEAIPERPLRGPKWLRRGRRAAPSALSQPDLDQPVGTVPFGELVPNCNVKTRDLGKLVDKAQGGAKFKLYDTDPNSTTPRTQYLTGFNDGCARQFTGSLALFGSPVVHEATRYNPNNSNPYSQTDAAYEKIKRELCNVRRGKHCPHPAINKLGRAAAFVSIYQGFGAEGAWVEVLLLNGEVVTYQTRNQ